MDSASTRMYQELSCVPIINCEGLITAIGGSSPSPEVIRASTEALRYFVDLEELLVASGRVITGLIGGDEARVTTGAAGAMVLATLACRLERETSGPLPPTGARHELSRVLLQRFHRYKYDAVPCGAGAALDVVGGPGGTTAEHLEQAMTTTAVAVLHPAHLDSRPGTVPLRDVIRLGERHRVPVIVDAAAQVYPLDHMRSFAAAGAHLVCFGGKYFGAPSATGIVCGQANLMRLVRENDFMGFERGLGGTQGRAMKLGREDIVALVCALREWCTGAAEQRHERCLRMLQDIESCLASCPYIDVGRQYVRNLHDTLLHIRSTDQDVSVRDIATELASRTPSIRVTIYRSNLYLSMIALHEGDQYVVTQALLQALGR